MTSVGGISSSAPGSATSRFDSLSSEDFIKVMFAQLTKQDPSAPSDSKDLLQQIGTIRSIESDLTLTKKLTEISKQNELTSAGSLIGKFARGLNDSGLRVQGFVDSVNVTTDGLVLNLTGGKKVALSRIDEIIDPVLVQPAEPDASGGS